MNICNYWTTFDWKGEMVEMRRWSKMVKVWGNAMNLDEFGGWCFISTVGDSIVCMKIWCLGAPIHSNPIEWGQHEGEMPFSSSMHHYSMPENGRGHLYQEHTWLTDVHDLKTMLDTWKSSLQVGLGNINHRWTHQHQPKPRIWYV